MDYNPFRSEIKDTRLSFVDTIEINDSVYLYFKLNPTNNINCPICDSNQIIKNGTKKRQLKGNLFHGKNTIVIVTYNRYLCKNCSKMFMDKIDDIEGKSQITNGTKQNVLKYLKYNESIKDISIKLGISDYSIIRIFNDYVDCPTIKFGETICVDEFKNLKYSDGKYAFVIYSPNEHVINDVLPDRTLKTLNNYFYKYEQKELNHVKYFVSDMYETYRTIKKTFFPLATHVVDAFHYIRHITDAVIDVRIRIEDLYDKKTWQYKILKKYARTIIKRLDQLNHNKTYYNPKTKSKTSIDEIITDILTISNELTGAYELLQSFYIGWTKTKMEDAERFISETIHDFQHSGIKEFVDLSYMFINWRKEIVNSFIRLNERRLNNEYIEGINNRIKSIKKAAYGYRKFENFRKRVMYIVNSSINIKMKK